MKTGQMVAGISGSPGAAPQLSLSCRPLLVRLQHRGPCVLPPLGWILADVPLQSPS